MTGRFLRIDRVNIDASGNVSGVYNVLPSDHISGPDGHYDVPVLLNRDGLVVGEDSRISGGHELFTHDQRP